MTDPPMISNGWQALVVITPSVMAFLGTLVTIYFTYRLRVEVNHRLTELVEVTDRSARAEGMVEGTRLSREASASQSLQQRIDQRASDKEEFGEPDPDHSGIRRS